MRKEFLLITMAMTQVISVHAQSRSERREQAVRESEKPKDLKGGAKVSVNMGYAKAYDIILNSLKKADYSLDSASQETGQIVTMLVVEGGWRQKGRRVIVTIVKEKDGTATLKCVATLQTRYKALQTEPWSEPTLDEEETAKVVRLLSEALKVGHSGKG